MYFVVVYFKADVVKYGIQIPNRVFVGGVAFDVSLFILLLLKKKKDCYMNREIDRLRNRDSVHMTSLFSKISKKLLILFLRQKRKS